MCDKKLYDNEYFVVYTYMYLHIWAVFKSYNNRFKFKNSLNKAEQRIEYMGVGSTMSNSLKTILTLSVNILTNATFSISLLVLICLSHTYIYICI